MLCCREGNRRSGVALTYMHYAVSCAEQTTHILLPSTIVCCVAGKVAVGLASHWLWVTHLLSELLNLFCCSSALFCFFFCAFILSNLVYCVESSVRNGYGSYLLVPIVT